MGNFLGHAVPGSFFFLFGIWYTIMSLRRYFKCRETGTKFTSTVTFECPCFCGRMKAWPMEGLMKVIFVVIGFSGEIFTGFRNGEFKAVGNAQHATMFFFFGITGVIDILIHYKAPLPPNIDYISNALAFSVEALLFNFHLNGRAPLDVLVHTLLLYVIIASIVCIFAEMRYRHNVLSPLSRSFLLMQQGTWFLQVGDILYHPLGESTWDENDHKQLMTATMYFTWHGAFNFLVILLIGALSARCYRNRGGDKGSSINMKRLVQTCGKRMVVNIDNVERNDSGSDIEFDKQAYVAN